MIILIASFSLVVLLPGNVMRISLLRGATGPDPHQDQGRHEFSFALMPHKDHFYQTDVPRLAAAFNAPVKVQVVSARDLESAAPEIKTPITVEGAPNVILDTIKRSDDDDYLSKGASKSIICRLYESKGGHATATLSSSLPVRKMTLVDLLERELDTLEIVADGKTDKKSTQIRFHGFQVVTVKIELWVFISYSRQSGRLSNFGSLQGCVRCVL